MIYRLDKSDAHLSKYRKRNSRRVPGNVPYVVDNLWEWRRPAGFPNRRHSIFCSPTIAMAEKCGGTKGGRVFQLNPRSKATIAQLELPDAREHSDVDALRSLLLEQLGNGWPDAPFETKQEVGMLWAPCLSAEEVEDLFRRPSLRPLRDIVWDKVQMWNDARVVEWRDEWPFAEGEIFLELDEWELVSLA